MPDIHAFMLDSRRSAPKLLPARPRPRHHDRRASDARVTCTTWTVSRKAACSGPLHPSAYACSQYRHAHPLPLPEWPAERSARFALQGGHPNHDHGAWTARASGAAAHTVTSQLDSDGGSGSDDTGWGFEEAEGGPLDGL
ncbi:hypothetical protein TRAPUB_3389 [Trametes pubescens]|uniref:Uncharacterized protein n=1 Tax=Trametes pubescens TaxID=154538 RepID=A0A1M2VDT2_TRAPU|nr:hypothetical protein TRAPUB_3389 [Trametes pubescens]